MAINIIDPNAPGQAHVDSYWAATAGPEIADATPVAGDMEVDIAIVGGGYTGLSTALHLGRKFGLKSHVLEANRIGWGCSGRNGGFASLGIGKTSMAGWIKRWGEAEARRIFDQSGDAVRLVRRLLSEEAIDADATPDGNLELAHLPNRMRELEHDQRFLEQQVRREVAPARQGRARAQLSHQPRSARRAAVRNRLRAACDEICARACARRAARRRGAA